MSAAMTTERPSQQDPSGGEAWRELVEPDVEELKAKVRAIIEDGKATRGADADHPIPADDPEVRRRAINLDAWIASVEAANETDLLWHRLETLDRDQHGDTLARFARSVAGGQPPKRNLILAGVVGPGKTSSAIATGWACLDAGLSVRFVEHSKYMLWLRPDSMPAEGPYRDVTAKQLRARMRRCDVLIVDDLGANMDPRQPVTQHAKEETLTLIGDRIDTPGRITIITTNHTSEHLTAMFGQQFMSRLAKNGVAIKFTGQDRRGKLSW